MQLTRSSVHIADSIEKMMSLQVSMLKKGFRTDDKYFLLNKMDYHMRDRVEDEFEFEPFK